jgi:hypothetical protein
MSEQLIILAVGKAYRAVRAPEYDDIRIETEHGLLPFSLHQEADLAAAVSGGARRFSLTQQHQTSGTLSESEAPQDRLREAQPA